MSATKRLLQDRFKSKPSSTPGGKGEKKLTDYFARKPMDASAPAWSQSSSQPASTPEKTNTMRRRSATSNNKRDGQSATGGARTGIKPSGRSQSTKQSQNKPSPSTSTRPTITAPIAPDPISRTISSSSTAHSSTISRSASLFDGVEIVSPPHITKMHKKVVARTAAKDRNAQVILPSKRKLEDDAENTTPRPRRRQGRAPAKTSPPPPKKTPRGAKKPRLSAPAEDDADEIELVPSSQSDEHELCVPRALASKDLGAVRESVEVWRRDADTDVSVPVLDAQEDPASALFASSPLSSPSSRFTAAPPTSRASSPPTLPALATSPLPGPTDIGLPSPTSPSQPACVPLPPSSPLSTPAPTSDFDIDMDTTFKPVSPGTPPPTSPAQEHAPTPDAKTRTAALVARIRAEAMREVVSSPEPEAARYADLDDLALESSDDDDAVGGWLAGKKPTAKAPKASPSPAAAPERRYGLRRRGRDALPTPAQSSPDPDPAPAPVVRGRKEAKRKRANPLEAMLREKKDAERKGSSGAALRRAEGEGVDLDALLRAPTDEEDEEDEDEGAGKGASWGDEAAARRAASRGMEMREGAKEQGAVVDEARAEDGVRLLDPGERQAVGRILSGDKSGGSSAGVKREVGVRVWIDGDKEDGMDVDGERALPALQSEVDGGVVWMLKALIKSNDTAKIELLLDTGLLRSADANALSSIVHWLIELALPDTGTPLSVSAFNALRNLPLSLPLASLSSPLPPALLISTLMRLGMKPESLQYVGEVPVPSLSATVGGAAREEALYRLMALVSVFARAQWLDAADIPHIVMALLLVGIDAKASEDLRRDVLVAIELACAALPADSTTADKSESATAMLVLRYASALSVHSQSRLLALFARGCPQALRIARFVAFGLLTRADLSKEPYTPLPPLTSLVGVLDADEGLFDVAADDTDYDALGARVDVLGVALSGIAGYVVAEGRPVPAIADDTSPRKGRERPPLELVKNRLDVLHGKIVDTRAVNLDRSRVKAALQRLAMRIFYQRAAVQGAGPKSLFDHWGRSRPSMD